MARQKGASPASNSDQQVATALWKSVGSFCFLSAAAIISGMASEKVAPDTFKLTDLDSYSITLFAIPLLACALIALTVLGLAYVRAVDSTSSWSYRIPPVVEGLSGSSLRPLVSGVILCGFLIVPWFGLGEATVKFFHGSYYYARIASNGCDTKNMLNDCVRIGSGWKHFHPPYGVGSLTNTPYRYEGNKTYIPVIFPSIYLLLFIAACLFCMRYSASLFWRPLRSAGKSRASPNR